MNSGSRHPLSDARLRLERARRRIGDLENALDGARNLHPHSWSTDLNDRTGEWVVQVSENTPTDVIANLSVSIGEIVFLIRSSLDHLIAQVLLRVPSNAAGNTEKMLSRSEFPIFTETEKYASFDWTKLPNISESTRTAIDNLQPCNRQDGLPAADHPLAVLQSLNNTDKHRTLIRLVTVVTSSVYPSVHDVGKPGIGFSVNSTVSTSERTAEVVRGRIDIGGSVDVYVNPFFEKSFKQIGSGSNQPIIPTLKTLLDFVESVVNDFDAAILR